MMTREEAIVNLEKLIALFYTASEQSKMVDYSKIIETLEFAAAALRPVSREQVEKMRGEWQFVGSDRWNDTYECQQCGCLNMDDQNFCPTCGTPMKDEAVDILWHRLEAMQDEAETV